MPEQVKEQSELQEENQSENVDNRLPYSPPKLRKHGKINNATNTVPVPVDFDFFGLFFEDIS